MGFSVSTFEQIITAITINSVPLDASVFGSNIEIPIDHTIFTISLLEPFVCLGKVTTVKLEVWSDDSSLRMLAEEELTKPLCALKGLG